MTNSRSLWLMRLYFLLWTGAGGFIFPFITLFYKQQGLSGTEMGWLASIGSIVGLVSAPLIGRISDSASQPRRILQACLLGSGILILLLSQQNLFVWMAVIVAAESMIGAPIYPLSDAQALSLTSEKDGYGSIRLWGSLGWAITALLGGWMVEQAGLVSVFFGYAVLYGLCILALAWITTSPRLQHKDEAPHIPLGRVARSLVSNRTLVGLALALAIFWFSNNGRMNFETLYMHELGASEQLIGWAYTYPALLELPIMLWADKLVRNYGAGTLFTLSVLMEALSLLVIGIYPSMASMLFMRAASGLYYSFFVIASVAYTVENAPAGQGATVLSLYFVTLAGIISLVSSPISGAIYDQVGAYPLYLLATAGTLIAWLVLWFTSRRA